MLKTLLATIVSIGFLAAAGAQPQPQPSQPGHACPGGTQPSDPSQPCPPLPTPAPSPAPSPTPMPMPSPQPSPSPAPSPTPQPPAQQSATERVFAKLHTTNQNEIQVSQLAANQAQSLDVKMFAMMLVDDHTAAENRLSSIGQNISVPVRDFVPNTPAETRDAQMDQQELQKLQGLNGPDFDREFVRYQIHAHQKAYNWIRMNAKGITDANAQAYVKLQAKVIRAHLQIARSLQVQH